MKTFNYIVKLNGFRMALCGLMFSVAAHSNGAHGGVVLSIGMGMPALLYLYLWCRQTHCHECGTPTSGMRKCEDCLGLYL